MASKLRTLEVDLGLSFLLCVIQIWFVLQLTEVVGHRFFF